MNIMKIADKLYKVFVVAGSEPLGTAGIQADMKAIVACGGYAAGAVTCIVDEDTTTALDIAAKKNDETLVKFLLKYS